MIVLMMIITFKKVTTVLCEDEWFNLVSIYVKNKMDTSQ